MDIINFTEPEGIAWTVCVIAVAIIVAPRAAELVRLPGLIGLILAGFVIGTNGFDLVTAGELDAIGEVGLLFLMFLAGLELDLKLFAQYRRAAATFGGMTFVLPFALAAAAALLLDYEVAAAVLIGSIWASHTLVAYPALREMDAVDNAPVAATVGATVITDTLALVVLAVVVGTETGESSGLELGLSLALGMAILLVACFAVLPWLARLYFSGIGQDRTLRFVFLVAAMMGAAEVARVVGIEGIVGAFFAGIGLNRFVPNRGALMERTHFFASSLFVPAFLISVGVLINPSVVADPRTLLLAGVFLAAVVAGKFGAAWAASRAFRFSAPEAGVMFSLSIAQAAATLAATLVGYDAGILDEEFLNAAVLVVAATLFIASVAAVYFGRRMPPPSAQEARLAATVIVPMVEPQTFVPALRLAARLALPDGGVVRPIAVVEYGTEPAERARLAREMLDAAQAAGIDCEPVVRVDTSVAAGTRSACIQYDGTCVVLARSPAPLVRSLLLGDADQQLAASLAVPVLMLSRQMPEEPAGVIVALRRGDTQPALSHAARIALDVGAHAAGAGLRLQVVAADDRALEALAPLRPDLARTEHRLEWLRAHAQPGDLVVVAGSAGDPRLAQEVRAIERLPGVAVAIASAGTAPAEADETAAGPARVAYGRSA